MKSDIVYDIERKKKNYSQDPLSDPIINVSPASSNSRRAQLIAKRNASLSGILSSQDDDLPFERKIDMEIERYRVSINPDPEDKTMDPLLWWKHESVKYPLLSKFVLGHFAFQATSVSSERIFNIDKMVSCFS